MDEHQSRGFEIVSTRWHCNNNQSMYILNYWNQILTFSAAVNRHRAKPIVADKVSFSTAVRDVTMCIWVDVPFRESKVNHVYLLVVWGETYHTVSELDVPMQYPSIMHEF